MINPRFVLRELHNSVFFARRPWTPKTQSFGGIQQILWKRRTAKEAVYTQLMQRCFSQGIKVWVQSRIFDQLLDKSCNWDTLWRKSVACRRTKQNKAPVSNCMTPRLCGEELETVGRMGGLVSRLHGSRIGGTTVIDRPLFSCHSL